MQFIVLLLAIITGSANAAKDSCVVTRASINKTERQESHGASIVETRNGLMVAWFAGGEGQIDSTIQASRFENGAWQKSREIAVGFNPAKERSPVWNPILLKIEEKIMMFYKVGPKPHNWWGALAESTDDGLSFSPKNVFVEDGRADFFGPTKSRPVPLSGGRWLMASSTEIDDVWSSHFEIANANFEPLQRIEIPNPEKLAVIQPTVFRKPNSNCLRTLLRSKSGKIAATESCDEGATWSPLELTKLPNPNSGINAITLQNGSVVLAYNDVSMGRGRLSVARSLDGVNFEKPCAVVNGAPWDEFSYPLLLQSEDGKVHLVYTHKRRWIEYVQLKF